MGRVRFSPSSGSGSPHVWTLAEPVTGALQHVCADLFTRRAMLVDVVDGLVPHGPPSTNGAEAVLGLAWHETLRIELVVDTHPHAEHVTASAALRRATGAPNATGVKAVARALDRRARHPPEPLPDPLRHFDRLLEDGERFAVGRLEVGVWLMPGHASSAIALQVGDALFVGDALAPPGVGTARADEPTGDAGEMWASGRGILAFPTNTRVFVGHDARAVGEVGAEAIRETTVDEHRHGNVHFRDDPPRADFVALRERLDRELPAVTGLDERVRLNLQAGEESPTPAT